SKWKLLWFVEKGMVVDEMMPVSRPCKEMYAEIPQYSAHGQRRFGVSLGSVADCLNAFCRPRRSSTIEFPYPRPDMQLLFKYVRMLLVLQK
ncbi:hypothetical protein Tco_1078295, partial [Tanacetum coccineum]